VTVFTNIPDSAAPYTLNIQGEVWETLAIDPRLVTFGQLTMAAASQPALARTITITNNEDEPAELSNIHSTSPLFRVDTKVVEPGKRYELTIAIATPLQPGNNSGMIEVSTNIPETPTLSIPVQAFVMPDVEVTPPRLTLPQTVGADVNYRFNVRNGTATPLQVTDLTVSNPAMKVELREGQAGASCAIELVVPAGAELAPTGETITFKTNVPSTPTATIPIQVRRLPATRPKPATQSAPAAR
jgi:hypothetical protein